MIALSHAVENCLHQAGLNPEGSTLLCAISGGADSVALLHALCHLRSRTNISLHAIHVQHSLRGTESEADEQFVRALCQELGVPLTVENAGLTGSMEDPGMETLARESRRRIFAREMQRLHADAILTAHHRDDQAETVLMHLLRGSGMQGLCGMPACTPFAGGWLMRPFLSLSKAQLLDALKAQGLSHREDSSNRSPLTARNALRLSVLPQLEEWFPGAADHVAALAERLSADEAFLTKEAQSLLKSAAVIHPPLVALRITPMRNAPEALRRRALRAWFAGGLSAAGLSLAERALSQGDTLDLCSLLWAEEGRRMNLPGGLQALRAGSMLHLLRQSGEALCDPGFTETPLCASVMQYHLPMCTIRQEKAVSLPESAECIVLPPRILSRSPVWRTPRSGDRIRPFGAPGAKELRRFLTDRKIPRHLRSHLPILCAGSEVLWIPGLCASESLRLSHVPPSSVQLILTGEPPLPHQA